MNTDSNDSSSAPENAGSQQASEWTAYITPFAQAIGKEVSDVESALKNVVGQPGPEAIALLQNEEYTPFDELKAALTGVPTAVLKKAVAGLRKAPEAQVSSDAVSQFATPSFDTLPQVPDDNAWLEMLKTGGVLKVGTAVVISGIRAALASRTGLYDLPTQLAERMESHSESLDEPVSDEFFKLRKLLTQRSYAEIFAALNVDGSFVSQKRKNALIRKLDESLWPALSSFHGQLKGWTESWQQGMANPGMLMTAFAAMATGGNAAMPPGMMQPPPTDTLRDAADGVIDSINKVFAGTGIPVAMALAYDAKCIKDVLENSTLPAQVGAANREQMLKMLDADVSTDYVRLERNITRYALGIMELPKVTAGNEELAYITSLLMLGGQIPWDKVSSGAGRSANNARVRRSRSEEPALS